QPAGAGDGAGHTDHSTDLPARPQPEWSTRWAAGCGYARAVAGPHPGQQPHRLVELHHSALHHHGALAPPARGNNGPSWATVLEWGGLWSGAPDSSDGGSAVTWGRGLPLAGAARLAAQPVVVPGAGAGIGGV